MKTYQKVYNLVKKIPKGKIATYGQIGQMLNLNPRVVGWALNRLAKTKHETCSRDRRPPVSIVSTQKIPWQRVINSKGGISTNKLMNIPLDLQKQLLEKEKIKFDNNEKIDLKKYRWNF